QAGSENFGYVCHVHVAESNTRAQEMGRNFLFANGNGNFAHAAYTLPPGFNSAAAIKRLASRPSGGWLGLDRSKLQAAGKPRDGRDLDEQKQTIADAWQRQQDQLTMIAGTPDHVIERIKLVMRLLRPGVIFLSAAFGVLPHEERMSNLRLLGEHVL